MKYSKLLTCLLVFFSMSVMLAKADSLEDEIAAARKKICGGLALSAPKKGQTFTDPKKVSLTVTRVPNKDSKTVNGLMIYSVDNKGQLKYLSDVKSKPYKLNKKATLNVDISKIKGIKFPGQFEFRVWVRNGTYGPDCNLYSPVFRVRSSTSHKNAGEEELAFDALNKNNDAGCTHTTVSTNIVGTEKKVNEPIDIQVWRETSSNFVAGKSLDLMSISTDDKTPKLVKTVWNGYQTLGNLFKYKDVITTPTPEKTAYFFKFTGETDPSHGKTTTCSFYSKAFFIKP